jgi:hypothetical protein
MRAEKPRAQVAGPGLIARVVLEVATFTRTPKYEIRVQVKELAGPRYLSIEGWGGREGQTKTRFRVITLRADEVRELAASWDDVLEALR